MVAQRGILHAGNGDTKQAIDDFGHVIRLNDRHAEAYFHRGIAYHEILEGKLAKEDFDKSKTIDPLCFQMLRDLRSPKSSVTFPDTRFGNTLGDQKTWIER